MALNAMNENLKRLTQEVKDLKSEIKRRDDILAENGITLPPAPKSTEPLKPTKPTKPAKTLTNTAKHTIEKQTNTTMTNTLQKQPTNKTQTEDLSLTIEQIPTPSETEVRKRITERKEKKQKKKKTKGEGNIEGMIVDDPPANSSEDGDSESDSLFFNPPTLPQTTPSPNLTPFF